MQENHIKRKRPDIDSNNRMLIRLNKKQAKHLLSHIIYFDDYRVDKNVAVKVDERETLTDIKNLLIKYIIE